MLYKYNFIELNIWLVGEQLLVDLKQDLGPIVHDHLRWRDCLQGTFAQPVCCGPVQSLCNLENLSIFSLFFFLKNYLLAAIFPLRPSPAGALRDFFSYFLRTQLSDTVHLV